MQLRAAQPDDAAAIHAIYAHHVLHGLATFEEEPPSSEEMRQRLLEVTARGLPFLVAEEAGALIGYGYCAPYRLRSAYRYALEDSIYVEDAHLRKGIGRAILSDLILRCAQLNYRQLIAVIGDSAQAASIGLHQSLGFVRAGALRSVGYKFGRWVDTVIMQRPLGMGDGTPP